MVMGALLEPNMETPVRSESLALVGASSCGALAGLACFSSNCRICRSSCRISSPCCCVMGFLSDFWAARGSAANTVANTRNFFIGYLVLPQDQHVLAVGDVFLLGDEMEVIGLDMADVIKEIEANPFHLIAEQEHVPDSQYVLILRKN